MYCRHVLAIVLKILKSLQRIRKMQSKKHDPLCHLAPFYQSKQLVFAMLKKAGSDVKDHVFHFVLWRHVAKIWYLEN